MSNMEQSEAFNRLVLDFFGKQSRQILIASGTRNKGFRQKESRPIRDGSKNSAG